MEKKPIKKSPIQIVSLSLQKLEFKKVSSRLRTTKVRPVAIQIAITVEKLEDLTYSTLCRLSVNESDKENCDFFFCCEYQVISQAVSNEVAVDLERFAQLGAPFNVLTHAREILQTISARAFGKSVILPLLDISGMASRSTTSIQNAEEKREPPLGNESDRKA